MVLPVFTFANILTNERDKQSILCYFKASAVNIRFYIKYIHLHFLQLMFNRNLVSSIEIKIVQIRKPQDITRKGDLMVGLL